MGPRFAASVVRTAWPATALAIVLTLTAPLIPRSSDGRAEARPLVRPPEPARAVVPLSGGETPVLVRGGAAASIEGAAEPPGIAPRTSERPIRHLLVPAEPGMLARANPWAGAKVIGEVATVSRYYHEQLTLWVEERSRSGAWGRVELPYVWPRREGWISLEGLRSRFTMVEVRVDLSERLVQVFRGREHLFSMPGAIGAPVSPTPPGDYVVTDRVPFSSGSSLGSFAFGISGIQPNLPPGWSGGDQLAIHGTNQPSSIGEAASAGCIRVSEAALGRLLPLLRLGTPVLIRA